MRSWRRDCVGELLARGEVGDIKFKVNFEAWNSCKLSEKLIVGKKTAFTRNKLPFETYSGETPGQQRESSQSLEVVFLVGSLLSVREARGTPGFVVRALGLEIAPNELEGLVPKSNLTSLTSLTSNTRTDQHSSWTISLCIQTLLKLPLAQICGLE